MKKVVLLGTAPSSMMLAPFDDPEWKIWGCSPGTASAPRIDRRYEVHRWQPDAPWFSEGYVKLLQEFKGPVRMFQPVDSIPNCELMDVDALVAKWGPYFFTSTIAWMMAEAMDEGFKQIALWGIDMAATTEYHDQRLGIQFFAMMAASMGIEITVPPESDVLRPLSLYGAREHSHMWIKETVRARELAGRQRAAQAEYDKAKGELSFLNGALDDQDWHLHSAIGAFDMMSGAGLSPIIPGVMLPAPEPVAKKRGRPRKK